MRILGSRSSEAAGISLIGRLVASTDRQQTQVRGRCCAHALHARYSQERTVWLFASAGLPKKCVAFL